jgi:hypothetical protein
MALGQSYFPQKPKGEPAISLPTSPAANQPRPTSLLGREAIKLLTAVWVGGIL